MDGLTAQEVTNMTEALKNPEFRQLFADYCKEMTDPKNQELYEQELTQYEAERGIELTFVTPEPGFVIKTTANGQEKVFINIASSEKVAPPTTEIGDPRKWSIPLIQNPEARRDLDKNGQKCPVYDVVFHPDALKYSKNREFRKMVVETALDAVESCFKIKLDRVNVKLPKMKFKGIPRPTVIRKKIKDHKEVEDSSPAEESFYPKVDLDDLNGDRPPTTLNTPHSSTPGISGYTIPKYTLIHRREIDSHEMTYELDAKLNTTIPHELVLTIQLPLLKSAENVQLDVKERTLELLSDQPAKYRLQLNLPYAVIGDQGKARFESSTRQLIVTLPVKKKYFQGLQTVTDSMKSVEDVTEAGESLINEAESKAEGNSANEIEESFLSSKISYSLPSFNTNVLDTDLFIKFNVENVDPTSMEVETDKYRKPGESSFIHLKFFNISSGFVPHYFAFYLKLQQINAIIKYFVDVLEDNIVLQLSLSSAPVEFEYGLDGSITTTKTCRNVEVKGCM